MKVSIKKITLLSLLLVFVVPGKIYAHCPLCTGGAGAAAIAAAYFGVKYGALGVFLGAFAVALSLMIAHKLPEKFKYQSQVVFWALYLSTVVPFYFMFKGDYTSKYISISGDYGSMLNRTYLIDLYLIGLVVGSLIVYFSPRLSAALSKARGGKSIKFQGMIINFVLLFVAALVLQYWPR